jgi:superfamily II DNA or RNA helicase/predicted house-cleaning noncanonical NTP pyrophosphatase (MazG superfamily)
LGKRGKTLTDRPLIYNKLVRDLIPEKIALAGKHYLTSILSDPAYAEALRLKLLEEAHELFHADVRDTIINESADLLELMNAIFTRHGISWDEVFSRQAAKREESGAFNKRQMLHATGSSESATEAIDREARLPQLLTFNSLVGLVDVIKRELIDADVLHIASAFYSRGMLNLLLEPFREFIRRGGRLRLLTSVMGNFNNPLDFLHLTLQIPEIEIRIFYPLNNHGMADFTQEPPPFHIKSFMFEKPTGQHSIVVGSSNLTGSGLARNHEWNYFSNSETNLLFKNNISAFHYALREFENYWHDSSVPVDARFINAYMPRWKKAHELRVGIAREMEKAFQTAIAPRPAQVTALQSLAERRKQGIKKTAVIAATGLGKTFLAAFDFKQSGMGNVLFIAHRESILIKALDTYRTVLNDTSFGEVLSGSSKPAHRSDNSLFAMIQTISQPSSLAAYAADTFNYIVIDEFHHAEASSYQRVLEKFRPHFLLGLTATPERMDGRDVLKICDYDVAFETRLFDAIENRWLVPFQYFAIHDPTDYSELRWTSRGYEDSELDALLMHDTRAALVFNNLCKFLPSTGKIKALVFCSSRNHAEYMNRKFNKLGKSARIRSVCLLGHDGIKEREQAIRQLQDEKDDLQIICSVDIFGEGVDIPAVSHVLFLRPTQSFTVFIQQLGRGLRQLPEKDFLVALDFVGNFRQSYVAPLALQGYTSAEDCRRAKRNKDPEKELPTACYVSVDTEVRRIWESEIKRVLTPANRIESLKALYLELRSSLGKSPAVMDFFANPAAHDPYVFLKEVRLGGNWLRVKSFMEDLTPYESSLLGTPAERLLQHLEKELSPARSYKMVVLKSLLDLGGSEWSVEEIAKSFIHYFLENGDRLADWDDLAKEVEPALFPISKVVAHLIRMPLNKLENTGSEFFELDKQQRKFKIKIDYQSYWLNRDFQQLVADRVEFGLARYFYRKDRDSVVASNMRGFAVEVPYAVRSESGFSEIIRNVIARNPAAKEWKCDFGTKGYCASMDVEIQQDQHFVAWTHVRYDDISRFPARIKAAATALFKEGQRGEFNVSAHGIGIIIKRK